MAKMTGAKVGRKPLGDLANWNRDNVVALIEKLRKLKSDRKISFKEVLGASKLDQMRSGSIALAQQRLARLLKNVEEGEKWKNLREDEYIALVRYLRSKPDLWSGASNSRNIEMMFPDSMFYSAVRWMGMTDRSLEDVRENFPGTYTIFRHSLLKPGHVLVGRLEIVHDKSSGAVKTIENYHVEDSPATPASDFELTGYLFRRNDCYKIISKETGVDELQYMFINMTEAQGGKSRSRLINKMSGILSDIQGHFYYSTRFYCIRRSPPKLTTIPVEAVAPEIMLNIKGKPNVDDGYIAKF